MKRAHHAWLERSFDAKFGVALTKGVVARTGIRNTITSNSDPKHVHAYVSGTDDTLSQRVPATWLCGMCLPSAWPRPPLRAKKLIDIYYRAGLLRRLDLVILRKAM